MDAFLQDIRYGFRQLLRQRGFSIVAVLTLALGIGASTAIFSIIDAAMLRPLPYPDPEQLVSIGVEEHQLDGRLSRPTASMDDMRRWQASDDVFSAVAGWGRAFLGRIVEGPNPERIVVLQVTESYISMHGVKPLIGRDFNREDMRTESPAVALLGYGYWQSRYGGRREVIGESLRLDDGVATIVGVLPASFSADIPVFRPLRIPSAEASRRGTGRVSVYGRLRPDVTIDQARKRLSARMPLLTLRDGSTRVVGVWVSSRLETTVARYRTTINVLAGAVGLILLIACVNVAGLLLARGVSRQSELAVRASLGAARIRLLRQLLTESFLLALAGGAVGVLLARLSLDAIVANIPMSLPGDSPARLNVSVLAAALALLVPTALLFGLVPAIRLSRVHIASELGGRRLGSSLSRRGSQFLIAAEVGLAVILVAGAGLMIRSFARLSAVDLGFDPDGVMTMEVLPLDKNPAVHKAYYPLLLQRLHAIPGVASAGAVDNFPLGGITRYTGISAAGESTGIILYNVMPGYFETLHVALRDGHLPTTSDYEAGMRGAILSESAARAIFRGERAVGHQFTCAGEPKPWTVLGVVADVRHGGPLPLRQDEPKQVYLPFEPTGSDFDQPMMIVLRPSGNIPDLANRLRRTAQSLGPRVLVERIRPANDWLSELVVTPRRRTVLLSLLGGLGLMLALVGVFGMTAYAVSRRTAEIGIRMAFGAQPGQVVRTMVWDSAVPIMIGTLVGLGGAAFATRLITSFLFETKPTEPSTFATVAVALATTGCVAALFPALRAARLDPAATLRAE
jgi:putative ABC transport system permease protein